MVDLALQVTLAILLLLTITWCMIVHHRLRRLRTDRGEMQALIEALNEATTRAEAAVAEMRTANQDAATVAGERRRQARQQSDELAQLMGNAVRVVKRLENAVERGATRAAELRTGEAPERAAADIEARVHEPAKSKAGRAAVAPASGRPEPAGRAVRRVGQLHGLLHGELEEALQALR